MSVWNGCKCVERLGFVRSVEAYAVVSCRLGVWCVCVYKADGWFDLVVAVLFVAVVAPALCVCVCAWVCLE